MMIKARFPSHFSPQYSYHTPFLPELACALTCPYLSRGPAPLRTGRRIRLLASEWEGLLLPVTARKQPVRPLALELLTGPSHSGTYTSRGRQKSGQDLCPPSLVLFLCWSTMSKTMVYPPSSSAKICSDIVEEKTKVQSNMY